MKSQEFSGTIKKAGINPYVDPPLRVSRTFTVRGYIPVKGSLNGKPFTQTLVPIGGGRHRLFINAGMRTSAKVDVGSRITVRLRVDAEAREVPMPSDLGSRLRKSSRAKAAWDALTPSRQKEIKRYLNHAKRPETLAKNIERVMSLLQSASGKARTVGGIRVRTAVSG